MKKVRFGAGKWNGVGGKVEANETYEQAAARECQEEIGVRPHALQKVGELHFYNLPDVEHYCHIYIATGWEGVPSESEEMRPQWFKLTDIPYEDMWPDDKFWLPKLLAGSRFKGKVVLENGKIMECTIENADSL